jgi:hypothetical protein
LGRFDRQHTETRDLPAILETAAEEFRASIEREVRTVIEAAQTRAEEIERQAEFNASQREQLSEHRAQQIVDTVFNRASRVLDSIDLVESALSGMLDGLRAELQSLAPHGQIEALERQGSKPDEERREVEQEATASPEARAVLTPAAEQPSADKPVPTAAPATEPMSGEPPAAEAVLPEQPNAVQTEPAEPQPAEQPQPEARPQPETQAQPEPEAQPQAEPEPHEQAEQAFAEAESAERSTEWQEHEGWPGPVPIKPEAHLDTSGEGGSEFDQMVRRQLVKMRSSGKSRADAERFLERFHFAGDYLGLLDEVYGGNGAADAPGRRRLFSRLRRRAG